jgi:PAS domain S-box-containing protein
MYKILIIEDDNTLSENTAEHLRKNGFSVFIAEDGVRGVQLAVDMVPDLILCEITIPRMNGYDVCSSLQAIPATSAIPFIFLTAKATMSDLRMGMQLGADDYITKPFIFNELLKAIRIRLEKIERIMRVIETKFYAMIDNSLSGVFIYQDEKFIYVNSKFCEISGYSKNELLEMSIENLCSPVKTNSAISKIYNCLKGKQTNVHEQINMLKKGQIEVMIDCYVIPITMKGREALVGKVVELNTNEKVDQLAFLKSSIKLTKREMEVLYLICEGKATKNIADKLFLSQRTIETHRVNLLKKTKSYNAADLVMFALKNKVIEF